MRLFATIICVGLAAALGLVKGDPLSEFKELIKLAEEEPRLVAEMLQDSPLAQIVNVPREEGLERVESDGDNLPFVFAHGMGDSCFNPGMKSITKDASDHLGVYGVCVPTGDSQIQDTLNGFLMPMDKSVDVFAAKIRADPKLAKGFNAVGFSQGNSLIRGYVQRYNDPPVNIVLHVHGTISGVAGFPQCNPEKSSICKTIAGLCGDLAYNTFVQEHLFQADYFRDPTKVDSTGYKTYSQLAQWNNEGNSVNATFKENFGKVNKFVLVKAMGDTMVFPNEGEWFGHFADGDSKTVLRYNETKWYKDDLFGLKTADEKGRIFFESTPGNHLQFTEQELFGWIDKYIAGKSM